MGLLPLSLKPKPGEPSGWWLIHEMFFNIENTFYFCWAALNARQGYLLQLIVNFCCVIYSRCKYCLVGPCWNASVEQSRMVEGLLIFTVFISKFQYSVLALFLAVLYCLHTVCILHKIAILMILHACLS